MVTCRAGVLGSPIGHSLSPLLHSAAYRALGLHDWEYTAVEVDEAHVVDHVRALDPTWRGLSLTMPLKELALQLASELSPTAALAGSVNTLVRRDERWYGDNTDVLGLERALIEAGIEVLRRVLVVGSGATARSALVALARLGAEHVDLMVRTVPRPAFVQLAGGLGLTTATHRMGEWPQVVDVVVSTVPGLRALALPRGGRAVLDVVYGTPSSLAGSAQRQGYAVVPGTAMLLHQAAEQVRLMTGKDPPVEAMRAALDAVLADRSGVDAAG